MYYRREAIITILIVGIIMFLIQDSNLLGVILTALIITSLIKDMIAVVALVLALYWITLLLN